ncbi:MAG: hypothetical protein RMJ56_14305 [Gemmataceae bacterium]|nr:hypothetical protein [Gemmata sp.]MDW8198766.1 hypothetical protein [Gemmataceae bacterium]
MRIAVALAVLWLAPVGAADSNRQLKVLSHRGLPTIEKVVVYQTKNNQRETVGEFTQFAQPLLLMGEGPFEVWVKPSGGMAVRIAEKLTVAAGTTHELKLGDLLGTIEVVGDDFPRAERIVITALRDPGPGEKGHVPLQSATEYRVPMCVPPGMYEVWVVPANGAKAQRVEDNVRVQAGRNVRVGG